MSKQHFSTARYESRGASNQDNISPQPAEVRSELITTEAPPVGIGIDIGIAIRIAIKLCDLGSSIPTPMAIPRRGGHRTSFRINCANYKIQSARAEARAHF